MSKAPSKPAKSLAKRPKAGRPPVTIDLKEVERLAGLGYPWTKLGQVMGLGHGTITQMKAGRHAEVDQRSILDAYERGIHAKRIKTLERLDKHGDKAFIPVMFEAKQAHILGYSDKQEVNHSGTVRIVREVEILPGGDDEVIDADFEEVD